MNNIKNILPFIIGIGIGAAGAWYYTKRKYNKIAQEEINSVKETLGRNIKKSIEKISETEESFINKISSQPSTPIKKENKESSTANSQTNYSQIAPKNTANKIKKESEPKMTKNRPYVISPDEFGENDDYDTISLMYYADKVLTDDMDEPIEDVDDVVGVASLDTFGQYEDDSVFVRNDKYRSDYEILLSARKYSEITGDEYIDDDTYEKISKNINYRPHEEID